MFGDLTTPPQWNEGVPHAREPQFHLQTPPMELRGPPSWELQFHLQTLEL
jgi:hypothetical protein